MENKKYLNGSFLVAGTIVAGFLLLSYAASSKRAPQSIKSSDAVELQEVHLAGEKFLVPEKYIKSGSDIASGDSLFLIASIGNAGELNPNHGSEILADNKRVVQILINDIRQYPKLDMHRTVLAKKVRINANEFVDTEYGLSHWTQPRGAKINWEFDLWIEPDGKEGVKSFILCQHKINLRPFQQCEHDFADGKYFYEVYYEKAHLEHWKEIEQGVMKLMDDLKNNSAITSQTTRE